MHVLIGLQEPGMQISQLTLAHSNILRSSIATAILHLIGYWMGS